MKLFIANIIGFFASNPAFIIGAALFVGLIFGVFAIQRGCESRQIEKKKTEVNALTNEAQNINANLNQLNIANQLKQSQVNVLNGNRSTAVNETDKSLENANRIRNKNYNGTTAEELERKSREVYK